MRRRWIIWLIVLLAGGLLLPVVPALAMRWTKRGDARGPIFWAGALGYLLYVYILYAYGGVYNVYFPLYLAAFFLVFTLVGMAAAVLYLKNLRSLNR